MQVTPIVALAVTAALLTGCGGASVGPSLAAAATKSSSAQTMKLDLTLTMNNAQLPQPLRMTATAAADNANHRVDMNIDMSQFASSLGQANVNPADWKGEEVADLSSGQLVIYMRLPFMTKLLGKNAKPWIKINLNAVGKQLGLDFSQFTNLSANPAQILDWLRATSGSIKKVGTETVDGAKTTHYHATIDLAKYPNLVPAERRAAVRKAINTLVKLAHVHTFPVDAWVGADGLIRKMHMTINEKIRGQTLGTDMSMRFHDFGAPVNVTLPPADQTVDISSLAGGK